MTIEIKPETYFYGVWYQEAATFNFMGALFRPVKGGDWTFKWRFRHYRDDKVHDSADVRNWYTMHIKSSVTETEAVSKLTEVLAKISVVGEEHVGCKPMEFCEMRRPGDDEAMKKLSAMSWAHPHPEGPMSREEINRRYGTKL